MNLKTVVAKLEALSNNLEVAQSVRERVRIADRIYEALNEIEQRVETFVVKEIGQSNGSLNALRATVVPSSGDSTDAKGRFSEMSIAGAAKILLKEHGVLHGKEIEKLLRSGGYESNSKKFQTTMVVALSRDGGFVNIGKNRWKLKEAQT
jgi:hypothetical protein